MATLAKVEDRGSRDLSHRSRDQLFCFLQRNPLLRSVSSVWISFIFFRAIGPPQMAAFTGAVGGCKSF